MPQKTLKFKSLQFILECEDPMLFAHFLGIESLGNSEEEEKYIIEDKDRFPFTELSLNIPKFDNPEEKTGKDHPENDL